MRILKKLVKRGKDGKPFYKHYITMPVDAMHKLNWQAGTELEYKINGNRLILEKEEGL